MFRSILVIVSFAVALPTLGFGVSTSDALATAVAQISSPVPFTLAVARRDGQRLALSHGTSTDQTVYESASTSKWVASTAILRLVDQGKLSLDDVPSQYIDWPAPGHPLGNITLGQLLSFTSGLEIEPLVMNSGSWDFWDVISRIAERNRNPRHSPGQAFYYSATHLQVAGAMAIRAGGYADWKALFDDFKAQTGLFAASQFDLPSVKNPRLAGGMHWTARDYLDFLVALRDGRLLSSQLVDRATSSQTAGLVIAHSPLEVKGPGAWTYGLGLWVETGTQRVSSPGAYGAYPFWDRQSGLVGILAQQGRLGSFPEGLKLERSLRSSLEAWAAEP